MTVIAYDKKSVSIDSLCTSGDISFGSVEKWIELPQGGFAFGCGNFGTVRSIFMALLASETPDPALYSDVCIVTVDVAGRVWEQDGSAYKEPVRKAWAWGTGREIALGALMAGASSEKAAGYAAKIVTNCGGKIHTFKTR